MFLPPPSVFSLRRLEAELWLKAFLQSQLIWVTSSDCVIISEPISHTSISMPRHGKAIIGLHKALVDANPHKLL